MRSAAIIIKLLFCLLFLVIIQCSSIEKRNKVLSFFFDGVPKHKTKAEKSDQPDNNDKKTQIKNSQGEWIKIRSKHPDYFENKCDVCHSKSSANFLVMKKENLCFKCHEEHQYQEKYIHGPVAAMDCLICHLPHESQFEKLLIKEGKEMCLYCHNRNDIIKNPSHRFQQFSNTQKIKLGNCRDCHYSHSSDHRYFLRSAGKGK